MFSAFEMTTFTPAAVACLGNTSFACREHRITGTWSMISCRTRAASSPFIAGIDKSNTIKSGRSAFAFSIASRPSTASPHTFQSSLNSRIFRMARQITGLSSTSKIRFPQSLIMERLTRPYNRFQTVCQNQSSACCLEPNLRCNSSLEEVDAGLNCSEQKAYTIYSDPCRDE
jgi:hypothetical protein